MTLSQIIARINDQTEITAESAIDSNTVIEDVLACKTAQARVYWSAETANELSRDACLHIDISRGFTVLLAAPGAECEYAAFETARIELFDALIGWTPDANSGHRVRYVGGALERVQNSAIAFSFSFVVIEAYRNVTI